MATSTKYQQPAAGKVSIHATLAGGDVSVEEYIKGNDVSIHATLAGGDLEQRYSSSGTLKFLSTPPSRVATSGARALPPKLFCFYPRHPRGWRHNFVTLDSFNALVSIHATLAGGDAIRTALAYR